MIDSPTRTVYIPLGAGAELIGRLRAGRAELGAVPPARPIRRIYLRKPLRRPGPGRGSGAAGGWLRHLTTLSLYSEETGLSLEADCGKGLFI